MSQINPTLYVKPYGAVDRADGWYVERGTNDLVAFVDGTEVSRITSGGTETITLADGYIFVGNAANVATAVAVSGDAAISRTGAVTVSDLTIASEARGDLLRRGASSWEAVSGKTSGNLIVGNGTDVISAPITGVIAGTVSGGNLVTSFADGGVIPKSASATLGASQIVGNAAGTLAHADGVQIVARASGKAFVLTQAFAAYTYSGAAYGGGDSIEIGTGYPQNLNFYEPLTGKAASGCAWIGHSGSPGFFYDTLVDAAIVAKTAVPYTNPGTAAGTLKITVFYFEVSI